MKQAEAHSKWCPFARVFMTLNNPEGVQQGVVTGINRLSGKDAGEVILPPQARCISSNCMAWRWYGPTPEQGGFCGLAGEEMQSRIKTLDS